MIEYKIGGKELIKEIEPLWKKLNQHHSKISPHFPNSFTSTFNQRVSPLYESERNIFITLASKNNTYVGYFVSSFKQNNGEIDSLFIDDDYRKIGIGTVLLEKSMNWFNQNKISNIEISVAVGNESAYALYNKFGFYPRVTKMRKIDDN